MPAASTTDPPREQTVSRQIANWFRGGPQLVSQRIRRADVANAPSLAGLAELLIQSFDNGRYPMIVVAPPLQPRKAFYAALASELNWLLGERFTFAFVRSPIWPLWARDRDRAEQRPHPKYEVRSIVPATLDQPEQLGAYPVFCIEPRVARRLQRQLSDSYDLVELMERGSGCEGLEAQRRVEIVTS